MNDKRGHMAALRSIGRLADDDIELAPAALTLGALDRPGVALEPYREHISSLAKAARKSAGDHDFLEARMASINRLMFETYG